MITDIFVSYFLIASFIWMSVIAWQRLIKVTGNVIGGNGDKEEKESINTTVELAFLFVVVLFFTIMSLVVAWYLDKKSTTVDEKTFEKIDEALELAEMLD